MRALKRTHLVAGAVLCGLLVLALAGPVRAAGPAPTATPAVADVHVTRTEVGPPIPPGFIGFSFEFPAVREYTGPNPHAINPVLVQLIRNLNPRQTPILRIGGNSTDDTWWPLPHTQPSPGIQYTLTHSWLATTKALAVATGAKMILGLNLKLRSAREITTEMRAYEHGIGLSRIAGFEIGNEPELYPITPYYYRQPGTVPVYPRPHSYDFRAYLREMARFGKLLHGSPLAGPASGSASWVARLPKLLAAEPGLKVVTYHRYPLIRCFTKPGDHGYPTIPNLLRLDSSRGLLQGVAGVIALAHHHGAAFRVDELNSVACTGQKGVSDTFASALWLLDTLFSMARSGVDGVNIHTLPDSVYKPFEFNDAGGRWVAGVQPEYYGLEMFAQAAPPGSRLLAVPAAPSPDLRERATLTPAGVIHLVLINDSLTTAHTVSVRPPTATAGAVLERLSAPGATATDGVTLGGQSFGSETATGRLPGAPRTTRLALAQGRYTLTLPPASAAMVSFAPAGRH